MWSDREITELRRLASQRLTCAQISDALARRFKHRRNPNGIRQKLAEVDGTGVLTGRVVKPLWSADEDRVIARLLGKALIPDMVAALHQECGTVRTENAVIHRIGKTHHGSRRPDPTAYLSSDELARLLGYRSCQSVIYLIDQGLLETQRLGTRGVRRIACTAIEAFIDAHPQWLNPALLPPSWIRSRIEVVQRAGDWIMLDAACRWLGVGKRTLRTLIAQTPLTTTRGRWGRGGEPMIWLKRAEVAQLARKTSRRAAA